MNAPGQAAPGQAAPGQAAPQCGLSPHPIGTACSKAKRALVHRGWYSRGYLPHFDSPHVIQHITYRLADSLPHTALEQMQAEVETLFPQDREREAQLLRRIDTYLDAGRGRCDLQEPEIAACVVDTWRRFDGERYRLLEWVVMPNHCHVLIEPLEGAPLGKIVLSWKNYTARFINVHRGRTEVRRTLTQPRMRSRVWQREYWDRFIRDERHFEAVKDYIVMNPVKAGLAAKPEDWFWSSAKERIADKGTMRK